MQPDGLTTTAGQQIGVGDETVTLRNDRRLVTTSGLWVRNGDRWSVTGMSSDGQLAVSHLAGHGRLTLPADYAADHVGLAYAVTVHKAQGVTVDRGLCVVDDHTTAEALYLGMTRGRGSNIALAVTDSFDPDVHPRPPDARDATGVFRNALARQSAEQSATESLQHELTRSASLNVLAPRLGHLNGILANRPPDRTIDLQRVAAQRARLRITSRASGT